jgi:hypothetical protein
MAKTKKNDPSIERKSRTPHIRGIKGEAVIVYCEPLITKEVGYHRLSRRVNKILTNIKRIKNIGFYPVINRLR